jgi:hypothetical protein
MPEQGRWVLLKPHTEAQLRECERQLRRETQTVFADAIRNVLTSAQGEVILTAAGAKALREVGVSEAEAGRPVSDYVEVMQEHRIVVLQFREDEIEGPVAGRLREEEPRPDALDEATKSDA